MVEPPPTATNPSNERSRAKAIASRNEVSVGSTRTLSYTTASIPFSSSDSIAIRTGGRSRTIEAVTRSTRLAPSSARSAPTSRVTPAPKRMLDTAISNAVSLVITRCLFACGLMIHNARPRGKTNAHGGTTAILRAWNVLRAQPCWPRRAVSAAPPDARCLSLAHGARRRQSELRRCPHESGRRGTRSTQEDGRQGHVLRDAWRGRKACGRMEASRHGWARDSEPLDDTSLLRELRVLVRERAGDVYVGVHGAAARRSECPNREAARRQADNIRVPVRSEVRRTRPEREELRSAHRRAVPRGPRLLGRVTEQSRAHRPRTGHGHCVRRHGFPPDEDDRRWRGSRRTLGDFRRPRDRAEGVSDDGSRGARAAVCISEGSRERDLAGNGRSGRRVRSRSAARSGGALSRVSPQIGPQWAYRPQRTPALTTEVHGRHGSDQSVSIPVCVVVSVTGT